MPKADQLAVEDKDAKLVGAFDCAFEPAHCRHCTDRKLIVLPAKPRETKPLSKMHSQRPGFSVERSFFKTADRTQKTEAKSLRSIGVGQADLPLIGLTDKDVRMIALPSAETTAEFRDRAYAITERTHLDKRERQFVGIRCELLCISFLDGLAASYNGKLWMTG
jgi:hypothetical protein